MDITLIVSLFTTCVAVASPFATQIYRCKTELKLKRLEYLYPLKETAYRNLANIWGQADLFPSNIDLETKLCAAANEAMLIADEKGAAAIKVFLRVRTPETFNEVIKELGSELRAL